MDYFRNMVTNLVATNPNLTSAQRLYIIKSHLTGLAEKRMRNVAHAGENCELVWNNLI